VLRSILHGSNCESDYPACQTRLDSLYAKEKVSTSDLDMTVTAWNSAHRMDSFQVLIFDSKNLGAVLTLQAAACTLTDQLNHILLFAFFRRPDPLKPGRSVIAIDIYAVQKQDVYVEVEGCRDIVPSKALCQPGRAGVTAPVARSLICSPALWISSVEIARYTMPSTLPIAWGWAAKRRTASTSHCGGNCDKA
jgi:hypothetical protein